MADRFFEGYVRPFVTGSGNQLKLRLVDGRGLPISPHFLAQLGKAEDIRRSFFADNPEEPSLQFKLESYLLDSNMRRAEFRLGNQQHEYRHGPIAQTSFRWPDHTLDGRASVLIEEIGGRRLAVEKNSGHWSLFRLIDQLQVEHHSGRDVLLLKRIWKNAALSICCTASARLIPSIRRCCAASSCRRSCNERMAERGAQRNRQGTPAQRGCAAGGR